jgi:hypothetical protein
MFRFSMYSAYWLYAANLQTTFHTYCVGELMFVISVRYFIRLAVKFHQLPKTNRGQETHHKFSRLL